MGEVNIKKPLKNSETDSMKMSKNYGWVVVGLLWVVALLNYMDRQMLSTMRPSMQLDIPELNSAENFGYLMSIFLWIYGLMSPVSGIIADKFSRKWLIVYSLFVWSAVTFAMGYAHTFNQIYWLRAIMGISEALYIPAGLSLIADFHSSKTRSLAIGIHMTGLYMGQALGGFGATVAAKFSWQTTFHAFGFIGIIYSIVLIIFLKEKIAPSVTQVDKSIPRNGNSNFLKSYSSVLSQFSFWIILLVFATSSLPGWACKNWLPTLFAQNLNMEMSQAGPLSTITIAISSFLGVITGGILSDKWVQKNVRGRVYTSAIGLALTIPSLLFIGFGNSVFYVVCAAICFGLGYGMFDANNMPILCQLIPAGSRAAAYGTMNMTGVFAGAIVTNILGKSSDGGHLGHDFAMLSAIMFLTILIQLFFLKPGASAFQAEHDADYQNT